MGKWTRTNSMTSIPTKYNQQWLENKNRQRILGQNAIDTGIVSQSNDPQKVGSELAARQTNRINNTEVHTVTMEDLQKRQPDALGYHYTDSKTGKDHVYIGIGDKPVGNQDPYDVTVHELAHSANGTPPIWENKTGKTKTF